MSPVGDAVAKLESLGTPEHIRMFFAEAGVTGRRANALRCVVAQYLTPLTPHVVSVSSHSINISAPDDPYVSDYFELGFPGPLQRFIDGFDCGDYPELEALRDHL